MQSHPRFKEALTKALRSLIAITPMLLAVIGLVGLFQTFVTPEQLRALFSGSPVFDTFVGTMVGGVSVGQPVVSYILGGEMLGQGISLYALSAFILAWVTLGIIQLPLEASLFGVHFTAVRNTLAFVFAMLIGWATGATLQVLS